MFQHFQLRTDDGKRNPVTKVQLRKLRILQQKQWVILFLPSEGRLETTNASLPLKVDQLTHCGNEKKSKHESGYLRMKRRRWCTKIPKEHEFCLWRHNSEMFTSEPFPLYHHTAGWTRANPPCIRLQEWWGGGVEEGSRGRWEECRVGVPELNILQRARRL